MNVLQILSSIESIKADIEITKESINNTNTALSKYPRLPDCSEGQKAERLMHERRLDKYEEDLREEKRRLDKEKERLDKEREDLREEKRRLDGPQRGNFGIFSVPSIYQPLITDAMDIDSSAENLDDILLKLKSSVIVRESVFTAQDSMDNLETSSNSLVQIKLFYIEGVPQLLYSDDILHAMDAINVKLPYVELLESKRKTTVLIGVR